MDIQVDKSVSRDGAERWSFPLVGSSFRASDGKSRQAALRKAYKKQESFWDDDTADCSVDVYLDRYIYDSKPAYRVYFDDREVGNVPASVAAELANLEDSGYSVWGDDCEIYGGPTPDFPDKHYGARLYVKVRKRPLRQGPDSVTPVDCASHSAPSGRVSASPRAAVTIASHDPWDVEPTQHAVESLSPVSDSSAHAYTPQSAHPTDTQEAIRAKGSRTRRNILLGALILCAVFYLIVAVIPDVIYALYD